MPTKIDRKSVKKVEEELADLILNEAQKQIENFEAIDTGDLFGSGRREGSKVIFDAPHASWIEFGTDPHPVSQEGIEKIARWAERKLGLRPKEAMKAARAIAFKIAREGTDPKPFLRNAVDIVTAKGR